MNPSTVFRDVPSSSESSGSFSYVDTTATNNGLGTSSHLSPIAEDSGMDVSTIDAFEVATKKEQSVGNYVSENGTEETSGFSNDER
jgi:hypothetical protein